MKHQNDEIKISTPDAFTLMQAIIIAQEEKHLKRIDVIKEWYEECLNYEYYKITDKEPENLLKRLNDT